jgi:predicted ATP-binding protein involved in virulence
MRIEELHLKNFRGFEQLDLKFPSSNLAVFIGVNGSGKSSILDGIAIHLAQFIYTLYKPSGLLSALVITDDDININSSQTENVIQLSNKLDKNLVLEIKKNRDRSRFQLNKDDINRYKHDLLQSLEDDSNSSLPLLVYYQTKRIVVDSISRNYTLQGSSENEEHKLSIRKSNQIEAYKTSFSNYINNFREFFDWFKEEEEYENEVRLREDNNFKNPNLEIVRKALEKFLQGFPNTEFSDLHVVRVSSSREGGIRRLIKPSLVIKKNGKDFKLEQLSDGEKTLLMLVVDIARRLAILNPGITDASELLEKGKGIVLIDEVDLHLHPQWQRIVLPSFTRTFPNCQFIVTTHSPQVLSGVDRENVFILEDSKIVEVTPHTFGRDTNSILFEVMGVEKRPVQMQERLDKCFEMIDDGDLEAAKLELQKLSEFLGNNDPEIVRGCTLIDFLNRVE